MALINFARREIEAKVVYYGPAMSGKTTNVESLHAVVPEAQRGDLHQLQTEDERTIYFDYVPISLGQVAGFTARFKLFTVPGQVFYKDTRRVLLQGADAVVFVADSTPDRAEANIDSLIDLEENLRVHGLDLSSIPLVIQLNKRDVGNARSVEEMETDLNPFGVPVVEAMAVKGMGVLETLKLVTDIAGARIRENLAGKQTAVALTAISRPAADDDRKIVQDNVEKIRRVRPAETERGQRMRDGGEIDPETIDAFLLENVERDDSGAIPAPVRRTSAEFEVQFQRAGVGATARAAEPHPEPPPLPSMRTAGVPKTVEPPPPPPRPTEPAPPPRLPAGPPVSCTFDPQNLAGLRVVELRSGSVGPDGRIAITMVANHGGQLKEHPLNLLPVVPRGTSVQTFAFATVAGALGLVLGGLLGWVLGSG